MKITFLPTGYFKLDGGAMFGVVPKKMWQKLNPADDNNLCTWALRCLLIETGNRKIVVDCGIGDKQDVKWRSHFEPHGEETLLGSLAAHGLHPDEITDVFFTHLHFDHCGGATRFSGPGLIVPVFPNATYWTNEPHWRWAIHPNAREAASFLKENLMPLMEANKLQFIDVQSDMFEWLPGIHIKFSYGHTEAMMCLLIDTEVGRFFYAADLMPSSFHLGMPYIMSYDIRPLVSLEEKAWLLETALSENWTILFEHDPTHAAGRLVLDEKGKIVLGDKFLWLP